MKKLFYIVLISSISIGCSKKTDPFLVVQGQIGNLSKDVTVADLETIFPNDSIVEEPIGTGPSGTLNRYLVYEKEGTHLLTITPSTDSLKRTQRIRILDNRYKTTKGISLASTFKDISTAYNISKIDQTFNNVLVYVDDLNAHFTISRDQLSPEIRFNKSQKIEAVHIPDEAKIKYFMLYWE